MVPGLLGFYFVCFVVFFVFSLVVISLWLIFGPSG